MLKNRLHRERDTLYTTKQRNGLHGLHILDQQASEHCIAPFADVNAIVNQSIWKKRKNIAANSRASIALANQE